MANFIPDRAMHAKERKLWAFRSAHVWAAFKGKASECTYKTFILIFASFKSVFKIKQVCAYPVYVCARSATLQVVREG